MAIRGSTSYGRVSRDPSGWFDPASDWTFCFWFKLAAPGAGAPIAWNHGPLDYATPYLGIFAPPATTTLKFYADDLGAQGYQETAATGSISAAWHYVAVRYTAITTTIDLLIDASVSQTLVYDLTLMAGAVNEVMLNDSFNDPDVTTVTYARRWQAALSDAEIALEMAALAAVRTTNLLTDTPLAGPGVLTDYTAHARDWTATGIITSIQGPIAPTNLLSTTATDLGSTFPITVTQDVSGATATFFTVWYTLTALTTEVLGFWGFGDLTFYKPRVTVYKDGTQFSDQLLGGILSTNKPCQFPVVAGSDYYFQIACNPAGNCGLLALSVLEAPTDTIPVGALVIPDDTFGWMASYVSAADGTVLRFTDAPFAAGEGADVLPDGSSLIADQDPTLLRLYGPSQTEVLTIAYPASQWRIDQGPSIRSNKSDAWYVGGSGSGGAMATIRKYSSAGALLDSWTLTGVHLIGLAPSNDELLIYVTGQDAVASPIVKIWNTDTDSFDADLTAGVASHEAPEDLLVLDDDSIVTVFDKFDATKNTTLVQYDPAGMVLNSTDFGADVGTFRSRLAYDYQDPTRFLLWRHLGDGTGKFSYISGTDFSETVIGTTAEVEEGVYQPDASATPSARFGHSQSCAFFQMQVPISPPFTTRHDPIRFVRIFPHLNEKNLNLFVTRLEIELQRGVGLISGQGSDPAFLVSASHDGGMSYSPERFISPGKLGKYLARAKSERWGKARDWVFKIVITDPVLIALASVYLDVEQGTS